MVPISQKRYTISKFLLIKHNYIDCIITKVQKELEKGKQSPKIIEEGIIKIRREISEIGIKSNEKR